MIHSSEPINEGNPLTNSWWEAWYGGFVRTDDEARRLLDLVAHSGCLILAGPEQPQPSCVYLTEQESLFSWLRAHHLKWLAVGHRSSAAIQLKCRSLVWLAVVDGRNHNSTASSPTQPSSAPLWLDDAIQSMADPREAILLKMAAAFLAQMRSESTVWLQPPGARPLYKVTLQRGPIVPMEPVNHLVDTVYQLAASLPHYAYSHGQLLTAPPYVAHQHQHECRLHFCRPIRSFVDGVRRTHAGEIIPGNHGGLVGLPQVAQ